MDHGHRLGLIPDAAYGELQDRVRQIEEGIRHLSSKMIYPSNETNSILTERGSLPIRKPLPLFHLLKRPDMGYDDLAVFDADSCRPSESP